MLARFYPELIPTKVERVKRIINILQLDIAQIVDVGSSRPTTIIKVIERALRAEYHQSRIKQEHFSVTKDDTSYSNLCLVELEDQERTIRERKGKDLASRAQTKDSSLCLQNATSLILRNARKGLPNAISSKRRVISLKITPIIKKDQRFSSRIGQKPMLRFLL